VNILNNSSPQAPDGRASFAGAKPRKNIVVAASILGLVIVVAVIVGAYRHHAKAAAGPTMSLAKVVVSRPIARELDSRIGLLGQFAAINEVELRALVGGTLTGIHFTDGGLVHRGRLIFASESDGRNTHYFPGVFDAARVTRGFYCRSCYP
jgi:multidrug efflux pump subunit AcrA (membrane-fusion protein)